MEQRYPYAIAVLIIVALMIMPVSTWNLTTAQLQQKPRQLISSATLISQNTNNSALYRTICRQAENSIVQITSKVPNVLNPQSPNATSLGSGFVYDKLGHVITNNHVVGDAKIVDITFEDGHRYPAKVIATDIGSDLAVLQIPQN